MTAMAAAMTDRPIPATGHSEGRTDGVHQIELALVPGPPADTSSPCRCCRGRSWLPGARAWICCAWCEGFGVDPESLVATAPRLG